MVYRHKLTSFQAHEEDLAREERHEEGVFSPDDFSPLTEDKLYVRQVDPLFAPPKDPAALVNKAKEFARLKRIEEKEFLKKQPKKPTRKKNAGPLRGISVSPVFDQQMNFPAHNSKKVPENPPGPTNQRLIAARNEVRARFDLGLPQLPLKKRTGKNLTNGRTPSGKRKSVKPNPAFTRRTRAAARNGESGTTRTTKIAALTTRKTRSSGRDVTPITFAPNSEFKRETRSSTKKAANNAVSSPSTEEASPPSKRTIKSSTLNNTTSTTKPSFAIDTPPSTITTPATGMSSQTALTLPSSGTSIEGTSIEGTPSKRVTRSSKQDRPRPCTTLLTTYDDLGRPHLKFIIRGKKLDGILKKIESDENSSKMRKVNAAEASSGAEVKGEASEPVARPSKKRKAAAADAGDDEDESDDDSRRNKKRKAVDAEASSGSDPEEEEGDDDGEHPKPPPKKKRKSANKAPADTNGAITSTSDPTTILATPWNCANRLCNTGQTWHPRDKFGRKAISNFFGRNKNSTKAIDDEVWHIYCRKDYQRKSYEGKKKSKANNGDEDEGADQENQRRKRDFQIKNIEMQLCRLKIWRPDAKFHVRLLKGTKGRMEKYLRALKKNPQDFAGAEAAAAVSSKKNKKEQEVPLSLEEGFPCRLMDEFQEGGFSSAGAGQDKNDKDLAYDKDYDDIDALMVWIKAKITAGETECLPPMEFLINEQGGQEAFTDPNENYDRWCAFEDGVAWTGQKDGDQAAVGVAAPAEDVAANDEGEESAGTEVVQDQSGE